MRKLRNSKAINFFPSSIVQYRQRKRAKTASKSKLFGSQILNRNIYSDTTGNMLKHRKKERKRKEEIIAWKLQTVQLQLRSSSVQLIFAWICFMRKVIARSITDRFSILCKTRGVCVCVCTKSGILFIYFSSVFEWQKLFGEYDGRMPLIPIDLTPFTRSTKNKMKWRMCLNSYLFDSIHSVSVFLP